MRRSALPTVMTVLAAVALVVAPLSSQMSQPRPFARRLECPKSDCPLLQGAPQTAGMRSGFVRLKPGETVGWHTTGQNEESLVILRGEGEALIDGQAKQPLARPPSPIFPLRPATTSRIPGKRYSNMCTWSRRQRQIRAASGEPPRPGITRRLQLQVRSHDRSLSHSGVGSK